MCTSERLAAVFTPGSHASTFGGNAVTAAAAAAAVAELAKPSLLEHVRAVGAHFRQRLERLAARRRSIRQVRGVGLMLAAELDRPAQRVVERCLADGLLINCTVERVLRFLPPLIVTEAEIDEGFTILERALTA
jgi:acetylornithine/succinyldiaminopimelate/putrescine aminotransferase